MSLFQRLRDAYAAFCAAPPPTPHQPPPRRDLDESILFTECDRDGTPLPEHLLMSNQPSPWGRCVPIDGDLHNCPRCGSTLTLPAISCYQCKAVVGRCPSGQHVIYRHGENGWNTCCTAVAVA